MNLTELRAGFHDLVTAAIAEVETLKAENAALRAPSGPKTSVSVSSRYLFLWTPQPLEGRPDEG